MSNFTLKLCRKCGQSFPATTEHFYQEKKKSGGPTFCSPCIPCRQATARTAASTRYHDNPELYHSRRANRSEDQKEAKRKYNQRWSYQNRQQKAERSRNRAVSPEAAVRRDRAKVVRAKESRARASRPYKSRDLIVIAGRQQGFCYYCQRPFDFAGLSRPTVDHRTPKARGGTDDLDNIVLACLNCNQRKGPKTADEFQAYLREYP
ncbi:restriction endonuclease [Deinococcus peraridilitoris DSM 19664]|uniref:Restriction endonuclease n=2 Tax=Deinococcus TaxID=1298 RepID=L0A241_DEIPD|nr:restriction endonuclease [Deinococcus peraridilitoris DSM 19664]